MDGARYGDPPPSWAELLALRAAHRERSDARAALAWSLADLEDLLATASAFDPDSGAPVPRFLSDVLADLGALAERAPPAVPRDAFARAAEFAEEPLGQVLLAPRTRLHRLHVMERPERVRAMDTRSMAWLARQPGLGPREKLGAARRMLAVVRDETADVPANRFVRRFAAELGARLDRAIAGATAETSDDDRTRRLRALRLRCRLDRGGEALAAVRAAVAPVPDNVLLGDRRYARLWNAWLALHALDDATASRWRGAARWLAAGVAWTLLARLARCDGAVPTERWVAFDPEHPGPEGDGACVRRATADGLEVVSVRADGDVVELTVASWRGGGRMVRDGERVALGVCAWATDREATPGAGHPAVLELEGERLEFEASRAGLNQLAARVLERLGLAWAPAEGAADTRRSPPSWARAGIDLAGPRVLASVDRRGVTGPAAAVRATARDGGTTWVGGARAVHWDTRDAGEEWSALDLWRAAVAPGLSPEDGVAVAALAAVARDAVGEVRPGARVAVALPDGVDEPSLAVLRAALGGAFPTKPRWVWRSVAAALGWRAEGGCAAAVGDAVVVLDLAMPRFGGATLVARHDDARGDGWSWERPLPPLASGWRETHDAGTALAESLCASTAALPESIAERAVGYGVAASPEDRGAALVQGLDSFYRLTPDLADATSRLASRAVAWALEFERQGALTRAGRASGTGAVLLLVVGAPLGGREASAVADALRREVPWCRDVVHVPHTPGAVVALGAEVLLERLARGEPTWVDLLPRLCLEVYAQGQRQLVEVFPRSRVRAGEAAPHKVDKALRIPAKERALRLPLVRDDGGQEAVTMDALIEHPSFPLAKDVEVRLVVRYSPADDGFHVTLRPTGPAPFGAIEVRWSRHEDTALTGPAVHDEPPAWPEVVPFDNLTDDAWADLERALADVQRQAPVAAPSRLAASVNAARRSREHLDRVVTALDALAAALGRVEAAAAVVFAPGRPADQCPMARRERVEGVVASIESLVSGHRLLAEKTTELLAAGRRLVEAAARAASRFRALATERFVRWALETREPAFAAKRWHWLGRALAHGGDGARREVLAALAEAFAAPEGPRQEHVWALSTALWADERFAEAAAPHFDVWWRGIERALDVVEAGGGRREAALFAECVAALLGLLRLRGGPSGARVSAHDAAVRAMGARVERIDRRLEAPARARVRVAGRGTLADVTASALRGESVARIEMITEEDR